MQNREEHKMIRHIFRSLLLVVILFTYLYSIEPPDINDLSAESDKVTLTIPGTYNKGSVKKFRVVLTTTLNQSLGSSYLEGSAKDGSVISKSFEEVTDDNQLIVDGLKPDPRERYYAAVSVVSGTGFNNTPLVSDSYEDIELEISEIPLESGYVIRYEAECFGVIERTVDNNSIEIEVE